MYILNAYFGLLWYLPSLATCLVLFPKSTHVSRLHFSQKIFYAEKIMVDPCLLGNFASNRHGYDNIVHYISTII